MELSNKELYMIVGGGITGAFLNYIVRGITVVIDAGRSLGSAIRRITSGNLCSC